MLARFVDIKHHEERTQTKGSHVQDDLADGQDALVLVHCVQVGILFHVYNQAAIITTMLAQLQVRNWQYLIVLSRVCDIVPPPFVE